MGKRRYRSVSVNKVNIEKVREAAVTHRVVLGIDVAKENFFATVMDATQRSLVTVRWRHPSEHEALMEFVAALRGSFEEVEVAMEPSGVYGDALRYALLGVGLRVCRVNPKQTHDAAEVYDGVPSLHDAKSAAIVAKLHLDGRSEEWPTRSVQERELAAAVRQLELYEKQFRQNRNRLEGLLARHWPEASRVLELGSATLLELLAKYRGPQGVAAAPGAARALMRQVGGHFLKAEKVDEVVASSATTVGVPLTSEEEELIFVVVTETRRNQRAAALVRRRIEKLVGDHEAAGAMQAVVGKTTAAVVVASVGDPTRYGSASSFVKALGLNLREKSSGKTKGGLHITKRGAGVTRLYLFLAVLRLVQSDEVIRAWYEKKVSRQGGAMKSKAIIAIMRKLAAALWHVAQGKTFDSTLLFDTRQLSLPSMTVALRS